MKINHYTFHPFNFSALVKICSFLYRIRRMSYKILSFLLGCIIQGVVFGQYRYDNTAYKTIYLEDLCNALQQTPGHLLLDVRSKGEFEDTSLSANLNIGRLKGAVNIDVNDMGKRIRELSAYKKKPVFVYCSHSQRSRRVSKMLADSGFTQVYNVNGAMTEFNLVRKSIPCAPALYETKNPFTYVSPADAAELMRSRNDLFILDVRNDSAFLGVTANAGSNSLGRFKKSVNIPFNKIVRALQYIPKEQPILVVAEAGREANLTGIFLSQNGCKQIYVLFNGLWQWLAAPQKEVPDKNRFWVQNNPFRTVAAEEMEEMLKQNPSTLIVDVRNRDEFNNQSKKEPWKNRGHVNNAINIPLSELSNRLGELKGYEQKNILLYSFGSANTDVFEAANLLARQGFTGLHVLTGGLWDIRWKAANVKGLSRLMSLVVDVPEENL
jgi:rhodanese-related sulfurtransferase